MTDITTLPYRPCVGIMLLNAQGNVFTAQRIDNTAEAWQMPQGGIDEGEDPYPAALRELEEETGVQASQTELIAEYPDWLAYDLPEHLVPKLWGGNYRGQKQRWFALRLLADDGAINIATEIPEFSAWKWTAPSALPDMIVPFKRDMYEILAKWASLLS